MAVVNRTFRLDDKTIKAMDRLITNPPSILIDGQRGAARNRTEVVEVLVKKALEMQAAERETAAK